MEKFRYLTSEDHAKWYVNDPSSGIEIQSGRLDTEPRCRVEMRKWIELNCNHRVYAWNKTKTPMVGEANWGKMVMPQGDMVFHFEDEEDRILFKLTWG
jgi:hypothetical protein